MPRTLRTLAVVLLVALLPLRAVAAVTIGFCAAGQEDPVVAAHGDHERDAGSHARHGGDGQPAKPATPACSVCVEHCSGAAFAPAAVPAVEAASFAESRISFAVRVAPAYIPEQLDRPPLALLR